MVPAAVALLTFAFPFPFPSWPWPLWPLWPLPFVAVPLAGLLEVAGLAVRAIGLRFPLLLFGRSEETRIPRFRGPVGSLRAVRRLAVRRVLVDSDCNTRAIRRQPENHNIW